MTPSSVSSVSIKCPICLDDCPQGDIRVASCGHTYCHTCVEMIKECGICRREVTSATRLYMETTVVKASTEEPKARQVQEVAAITLPPLAASALAPLVPASPASSSSIDVGNRILSAIKDGRFSAAERYLHQIPDGKTGWIDDGENGSSLVKASANPKTPAKVIALLIEKGINPYMCENPEHFAYDCAIRPPVVAAREGNVTALKVFIEKGMYSITDLRNAASNAAHFGQAEALDILLPQERFFHGGHGIMLTESVSERMYVSSMVKRARETKNDRVLAVLRKHYPKYQIKETVV